MGCGHLLATITNAVINKVYQTMSRSLLSIILCIWLVEESLSYMVTLSVLKYHCVFCSGYIIYFKQH